uniref:GlgB N-terminal domain-containing protein n=1 Tax=Anaerococcus mediterraneensis TaxID=1870984 RepID=UPI0009315E4D|nr:alpha amylase C-terminal domain-containing protein [Anaerococcus mediterraneensis]
MNTRDYLNGKSADGYEFFGAHKKDKGYIFRLLAPQAQAAYIVGDFNNWEKTALRKYNTGVFSISIDQANANDRYQYIIEDKDGNLYTKIDPYSKKISMDEKSSVIVDDAYKFKYKKIKSKVKNIYQLHLGSLFRQDKDREAILDELINHLKTNNFSHLQFMPVNEYVNYKQMGYSSIGLFSLSERYGDIIGFKKFVDRLHKEKIGIIVEIDTAEFDPNPIYLDYFDESNLYNYDYDNIKYNYFGSINFDPKKNLVKSYLASFMKYYTKDLNIDGIYFSSVENNIYWQGDFSRGINDDWISLLKDLNEIIKAYKSISIAGFNGSFVDYDLGFDYIFDREFSTMVEVFQDLPINRANYQRYIKNLIANGNEKKIFGFSYVDSYTNEASLAMKIHSDDNKIKQLKTLFTFLYSLKSSKLIFMGDELSDFKTFSIYDGFEFNNFNQDQKTFNDFYKDLSDLYKKSKALSDPDSMINELEIEGYSIYAYERSFEKERLLVIVNFTDISYEIKSPYDLDELINTDELVYGGSGNINLKVEKGDEIMFGPFTAAIFKIK